MTDEALAGSDNSEQEPQSDNQETETLLNIKADNNEEVSAAEPEPMPHISSDDNQDDPEDWGERPDFIPEQFWSEKEGPDIEGAFEELNKLNKDYKELRTKMSQGLHKAPKDGEYATDIMTEANVPSDDEMLSGYLDLAKKHGISQDAFNDFASLYFDAAGAANDFAQTSIQEEKGKLGRNADKIITETSTWLTKLSTAGVINDQETEAIANASTNASFITALNKIRQSYNESPIPAIDIQEGNKHDRAELDAMVADERYGKDMVYTKKVEDLFVERYDTPNA
jgi:hypothetical protein